MFKPNVISVTEFSRLFVLQSCFLEISSCSKSASPAGVLLSLPPGTRGRKMVGELADLIDRLLEEWFPGLLAISVTGEPLMRVMVPCVFCPGR
jgi:hypothetical protein